MDYHNQIARVTRTVTSPGPDLRGIVISQILDQDVQTVWDHITNPSLIAKWFSPVTGDLRQGGRFQIQGNASGTIESCRPPSSFRLTWEMPSANENDERNISWVSVKLTANTTGDATTQVELSHTQRRNDHWRKYGAGAGGVGWDMSLAGLVMRLEGVEMPEPAVWFADEKTREFLRGCSLAWGRAAVEGGEGVEGARRAVVETTGFYVPG